MEAQTESPGVSYFDAWGTQSHPHGAGQQLELASAPLARIPFLRMLSRLAVVRQCIGHYVGAEMRINKRGIGVKEHEHVLIHVG